MRNFTRRAFARQAGLLSLIPTVAAASPVGNASAPDPELVAAARDFKAALDRAVAVNREADRRLAEVRAGRLDEAEYDAWYEAEGVDDVEDAVGPAQDRLYAALRERDLSGVILGGLAFMGPWTKAYEDLREWPWHFAICEAARIVDLDATGGPR